VADPERVVDGLRAALAAEGLQAAVIFSGGEDLDILPSSASKGKALSFLLRQVGAART
jgi:hydroxymethylpyrimidine pyrophosphatase-like HAD family hydrolase